MTTHAIIFSRNRAMQLDALLRSIKHYAKEAFQRITVVFRVDTVVDNEAYRVLHSEHRYVDLWREDEHNSFYALTIGLPEQLATPEHYFDQMAFFVDDDIFYRPAPPLVIPDAKLCLSLRLGSNINWCYTQQKPQHMLIGSLDFDYAWSLDGHVFRTKDVQAAMAVLPVFTNPNQLEDLLQGCPKGGGIGFPHNSCIVNIPHNRVQDVYKNRHMGGDPAYLTRAFLAGKRIDFEAMDFTNVNSPHMEIALVLK